MNSQDELFGAAATGVSQGSMTRHADGADDSGDARVAVVPTCRSNLLEWLSSGVITPRDAFDKYYDDPLAIRPDLVPVVLGAVGTALLDVERAGAGNFPVLVEVDPNAAQWSAGGVVGWLGPTPLTAALRVHFRDAEDQEEFGSRVFDNVAVDRLPHMVSPELFRGGGVGPGDVKQALEDVEPSDPAVSYRTADRLAGGRALGVLAASKSLDTLDWVARAAFAKLRKRARRKPVSPDEWLEVSPELDQYKPPKNATLDERIFRAAACSFLAAQREDAWDARAALAQVDELLSQDALVKAGDRERWESAVTRTNAILRGDEAFEAFRAGDFRTEKALLLVLVRNDPRAVLGWVDERTGAHPEELVIAALLSGLMSGRKALPTELRHGEFDMALALRELDDVRGTPPNHTVEVDVAESVTLKVDDVAVLTADRPPRSALELLDGLDLSDAQVELKLVDLALARGWNDAITTRILVSGPVTAEVRKAGLELTVAGTPEVTRSLSVAVFRARIAEASAPDLAGAILALTETPGAAHVRSAG